MGNTWTTSKFGDGASIRGPDEQTITTSKFGSAYITRGSTAATPASSPVTGTVIILPAWK